MKFRIRIAHGLYHYLLGLVLLGTPWLMSGASSEVVIHSATGAFMVVTAALSVSELGLLRLLSYKEYLYISFLPAVLMMGISLGNSLSEALNLFLFMGGILSASGSVFSLMAHHVNRHRVQLNHS